MPFRDTPYRFPNSQRNQFVLVEQRAFGKDFGGAPFAVYEETIPQGSAPDVGSFGVFEPYVYNERNHTQSRHRFVQIDVNAAAVTFRYRTADDGSVVKETREVVPSNFPVPTGGVNLLNATRSRMDGNHEMLVRETLETFPVITDIEQANDAFSGLDTVRKRQRLPHPYETSPVITQDVTGVTIEPRLFVTFTVVVATLTRTVQINVGAPAGENVPGELTVDTTDPAVFWPAAVAFANLKLGTYGFIGSYDGTEVTFTYSETGTAAQAQFTAILSPLFGSPTLYFNVSENGTGPLASGPTTADGFQAQGETPDRMMSMLTEVITPAGNEQITLRDWVPSVQASQVTRKVEVVGTNSNPSATYLDIAIQDKKIAIGKKLRTRFSVAAWLDFVDYEVDAETQESVIVTKRVLDKATYAFEKEARVDVSVKQLDHLRVLETRRELSSGVFGKSFKTTKNIQYRFPGWLVPGQEYQMLEFFTSRYFVGGLNEKNGQVLTVPADVYISYHPTKPLAPDVFQFFTASFAVSVGTSHEFLDPPIKTNAGTTSLSFNDLIVNDAECVWKNVVTGPSGNPQIGVTVMNIGNAAATWLSAYGLTWSHTLQTRLPESKPNASLYVQMMEEGYEVLVGVEIEQWKYNLWRQTRTYIKIPNLMTPGLAGL